MKQKIHFEDKTNPYLKKLEQEKMERHKKQLEKIYSQKSFNQFSQWNNYPLQKVSKIREIHKNFKIENGQKMQHDENKKFLERLIQTSTSPTTCSQSILNKNKSVNHLHKPLHLPLKQQQQRDIIRENIELAKRLLKQKQAALDFDVQKHQQDYEKYKSIAQRMKMCSTNLGSSVFKTYENTIDSLKWNQSQIDPPSIIPEKQTNVNQQDKNDNQLNKNDNQLDKNDNQLDKNDNQLDKNDNQLDNNNNQLDNNYKQQEKNLIDNEIYIINQETTNENDKISQQQ